MAPTIDPSSEDTGDFPHALHGRRHAAIRDLRELGESGRDQDEDNQERNDSLPQTFRQARQGHCGQEKKHGERKLHAQDAEEMGMDRETGVTQKIELNEKERHTDDDKQKYFLGSQELPPFIRLGDPPLLSPTSISP